MLHLALYSIEFNGTFIVYYVARVALLNNYEAT